MSRYIIHTKGQYLERIQNMNECKYRIDDVCCNDSCEERGDFPDRELCLGKCRYFIKEDGKIN